MASDALTDAILAVVEPLEPAVDNARMRVQEIVAGHGLAEDPPGWMVDFFTWVAEGRETPHLVYVPTEYPRGGAGLANILAGIDQRICKLENYEEYGEGMEWDYAPSAVAIFISHESAETIDGACVEPLAIRRLGSDMNAWLTDEYRR